jgi:predicted RNA-binding Zn ribbon-like protein
VSFEFIADRPVLDFIATVAERGSTNVERLGTPADLRDWVVESGLVDMPPAVSDRDLAAARTLRDAMFRLVASRIDHTPPAAADRDLVNAAASLAGPVVSLTSRGQVRHRGGLDAALAVLARDCLELHADRDGDDLKWCADALCTRPFVDRSHGHRRRWCGMKGCGDRAKAAAYRARQRDLRGNG